MSSDTRPMRTGAYARYSSDLQRETSLDDQLRVCREYAERYGWTWQDGHLYTDAGVSGSSIEGRPGLQAMLAAAKTTPRPFDILLVDDSSRVARDLGDALRVIQELKFAGIRVIYISQGIDSDSEQAETLLAVHGIVDQLYLREMSTKVRRGLRGQLERGFATGGITYGYITTPVADPGRPGEFVGHRHEIEPTEANVVRQIFEWYAEGITLTAIIKRLHEQGVSGPRGGNAHGQWRRGAIRRLLANSRYIGQHVWGRTRGERRPGSRSVRVRAVPQKDWHVSERPELRIVSDDLWQRVQTRRAHLKSITHDHRQPGSALLRGSVPELHGQRLFAGALFCGVCGKAVGVTSTNRTPKRVYRYYGCGHFARNGLTACTNQVTVAVDHAERHLLAGLDAELRRDTTVHYIVDRLTSALQAHADARPERHADLTQQREAVRQKIQRLVQAVENSASSTSLLETLAAREGEAAALDAEIGALETPVDDTKLAVIPTWVRQQLSNLSALLQDDPDRLRAHLARLGVVFTLYPVYDVPAGARPYLRAVGEGQYEHLIGGGDPAFGVPVHWRGRAERERSSPPVPSTSSVHDANDDSAT